MTFTPVVFNDGDPGDADKFNTLAQNQVEFNNNLIVVRYSSSAFGSTVIDSDDPNTPPMRMWVGHDRLPITNQKRSQLAVDWSGFFSDGCVPVVNVTVGRRTTNRLWISVKGFGSDNWPDHRGCVIEGVVDPDAQYNLDWHMPLHIQAIGY